MLLDLKKINETFYMKRIDSMQNILCVKINKKVVHKLMHITGISANKLLLNSTRINDLTKCVLI